MTIRNPPHKDNTVACENAAVFIEPTSTVAGQNGTEAQQGGEPLHRQEKKKCLLSLLAGWKWCLLLSFDYGCRYRFIKAKTPSDLNCEHAGWVFYSEGIVSATAFHKKQLWRAPRKVLIAKVWLTSQKEAKARRGALFTKLQRTQNYAYSIYTEREQAAERERVFNWGFIHLSCH